MGKRRRSRQDTKDLPCQFLTTATARLVLALAEHKESEYDLAKHNNGQDA